MLAVRALDALLDYQNYPVPAARKSTMNRRPLGVGLTNLAYWLAKNDLKYSDPAALARVDEITEAWSYYLIKASVDLAKEKGACPLSWHTKYHDGIVPVDTRKPEIDELVEYQERMPWTELRNDLKTYGIRNSTLMAVMPVETSSQILNSTNGIEPVRGLITVKQSKDGILKQVVPEYRKLKNKYELLWDQTPEGYLKIAAVIQKYMDQTISTNTSYNPQKYAEEKIPMSEMLTHILMCYKYGIKTLYYFNTNDSAGEIEIKDIAALDTIVEDEEDCSSCKL
jgi:ribonucleoside-diphosphate reductase alpha chain